MAMQRNYFTVLFFLKKSKLLKNGEAPICMRITINGKRAEIQIKRGIDVAKWNAQKECAIGKERKYQEINHFKFRKFSLLVLICKYRIYGSSLPTC